MPTSPPLEDILDPDLPICDPHHHLWHGDYGTYLLPELMADLARGHRVESTVHMEVAPHGVTYPSGGAIRPCAGVVTRIDLEAPGVDEAIEGHIQANAGRLRGVVRPAAWDAGVELFGWTGPDLYEQPAFRAGFSRLAAYGLSFDAFQSHAQLPYLTALARTFPDTAIVVDHVGFPVGIGPYAGKRAEVFEVWSKNLREVATCPNVSVKLGGLGTAYIGFAFDPAGVGSPELAKAWRPYIETCIEAFGAGRCMFESNFPVDRVAGTYDAVWNAFKLIAAGASADEKASLFRDTAVSFYRLDV